MSASVETATIATTATATAYVSVVNNEKEGKEEEEKIVESPSDQLPLQLRHRLLGMELLLWLFLSSSYELRGEDYQEKFIVSASRDTTVIIWDLVDVINYEIINYCKLQYLHLIILIFFLFQWINIFEYGIR
jgi:WD40 repeat protein